MIPDLAYPMLLGLKWMDPEWLLDQFGQEMFWISLAIIFIECGLLFPILPGDSLLFSVGLFIHRAGAGEAGIDVNIALACVLLATAAFLGNVTGYEIGRFLGPKIYQRRGRFLKQEYFTKTEQFFDKHGAKALVLGRFVPIVRTFITLVAGVGKMNRRHFFLWSLVGAVLWAVGITLLGYFLGGIEFLQDNIEAALLLIVAISVLPMVIEWWRHRRAAAAAPAEETDAA
ncbi:VTT domain-containing protein [Nocardioides alcanivorans]|uniref:VTT domain-containing protein n=1 Tax=Nocardioides alcanivorans TaxID=2897352 RepID=UPI001F166213|nr:VTT domain-containing protein [Nocardioides alcanivorans]